MASILCAHRFLCGGHRGQWMEIMGSVNLDGKSYILSFTALALNFSCICGHRGTCDLSTIEIKVLFYIIVCLLKIFHIPVSAHHYSGIREAVIPTVALCLSTLVLQHLDFGVVRNIYSFCIWIYLVSCVTPCIPSYAFHTVALRRGS